MSSIRLYILDALARRGDMHGHQLRLLAEEEHLDLWTDISVGALYGAIKRLAVEGLVAEVRTEREGNYPERQVYGITEPGRASLAVLHQEGLVAVVLRPDPFDLALSRPDPNRLDELGDALAVRLATLHQLLEETDRASDRARPYLSTGELHAMVHRTHRIRAEISWHEDLIAALPEVIADERARVLHPEPLPTSSHHPKEAPDD